MVYEKDKNDSDDQKFQTLVVSLKRLKTQNVNPDDDDVINFCHKDQISRCFFFALFYNLVMKDEHTDDALFPRWKRNITLKTEGTDSQVSQEFKRVWSIMHKKAMQYSTDINDKCVQNQEEYESFCFRNMSNSKGIHCGKKKGVQDLGDSDLVPQVSFIYEIILIT